MSNIPARPRFTLEDIARAHEARNREIDASWRLVVRGIEYHQLDETDLAQLIDDLRSNRDFIVDELGFEFVGGALRVSLLDERAACSPEVMLAALNSLYLDYESGR